MKTEKNKIDNMIETMKGFLSNENTVVLEKNKIDDKEKMTKKLNKFLSDENTIALRIEFTSKENTIAVARLYFENELQNRICTKVTELEGSQEQAIFEDLADSYSSSYDDCSFTTSQVCFVNTKKFLKALNAENVYQNLELGTATCYIPQYLMEKKGLWVMLRTTALNFYKPTIKYLEHDQIKDSDLLKEIVKRELIAIQDDINKHLNCVKKDKEVKNKLLGSYKESELYDSLLLELKLGYNFEED